MSADDFQMKFSSVAESMLKAAIAETTKLFETMVDELKAEISNIKKENEDLKMRCSQFENARSQSAVYTRESEPLAGPSAGCEKRDRAVQCGELRCQLPLMLTHHTLDIVNIYQYNCLIMLCDVLAKRMSRVMWDT